MTNFLLQVQSLCLESSIKMKAGMMSSIETQDNFTLKIKITIYTKVYGKVFAKPIL